MAYRSFDPQTALNQIGMDAVLYISGGRAGMAYERNPDYPEDPPTEVLRLPVAYGYQVEIRLNFLDLYEVRRTRGGKTVATVDNVYASDLARVARRASNWREEF